MRPYVRTCIRTEWHISKTAPIIFEKLGMNLGVNKADNIALPFFKIFGPFSGKPLIYANLEWRGPNLGSHSQWEAEVLI